MGATIEGQLLSYMPQNELELQSKEKIEFKGIVRNEVQTLLISFNKLACDRFTAVMCGMCWVNLYKKSCCILVINFTLSFLDAIGEPEKLNYRTLPIFSIFG